MKHYTLSFHPGTEAEISGTKAELISNLQNLIDEIKEIDEDDTIIDGIAVPLVGTFGESIVARIEETYG